MFVLIPTLARALHYGAVTKANTFGQCDSIHSVLIPSHPELRPSRLRREGRGLSVGPTIQRLEVETNLATEAVIEALTEVEAVIETTRD